LRKLGSGKESVQLPRHDVIERVLFQSGTYTATCTEAVNTVTRIKCYSWNSLFLNSPFEMPLHLPRSESIPFSFDTATTRSATSSTTWGPGTRLSGKALVTLGKASIRGFENILIFRRLQAIQSHIANPKTTDSVKIEQIYCDLLELTRLAKRLCIPPTLLM
jgi:hypothetical protein